MRNRYFLAAAILALISTGAAAQPADAHHPAEESAANRPAPAATGMMSMMDMMMPMMRMMNMMGSGDAPGMGMIDHVEGRIAYLRAELKITDAQASAWNGFAAALRTNAQTLAAARPMMMGAMNAQQTAGLSQRLDSQERWLAARLDGTRAIKAAFTRLYAALSADQKKAADGMLAPHMGMAMPMMMPGMSGH